MKKTTIIIGITAMFAVLLANLAILPTLVPGYLAEGATPPTDVSEVEAASDQLKRTALALFLAAVLVEWAPTPRSTAPLILCACAAVVVTVSRSWDVVAIILVWAPQVRGERAGMYWVCVAVFAATVVPALFLIVT